ncbi:MAG: ABC transporter ATP-binding protein [Oscillospiraceae bacterium]|jgi:putative ABC transport system ATP-binding protein|nr:ABC transporter ATP-binding protein [Oscillospiraceae bacterium]
MIKLINICKTYNKNKRNEVKVLRSLCLDIVQGEMIAIIGPSGVGKSTLLHIIACIDSAEQGEYWLDDRLISGLSDKEYSKIRNRQVGIVLQDFALIEEYTVLQNVMTPLMFGKRIRKAVMKERTKKALENVGISELANQYVWSLSGGQKQRTAIARAIINEPKLILADEPTGALDEQTTNDIMQLFTVLNQIGHTIIIITHDPVVAKSCKRVLFMRDGVLYDKT